MKAGILLALLTIIFGFALGVSFGAFEDAMKGHLKSSAAEVLATAYQGDEANAKKVVDKSWAYFQRAHLHANGIATTSLALILLLGFMAVRPGLKGIVAAFLGLGSLGYSLFWLLAGLRAPGLGSTGAAKETLSWLALPSVTMLIAGVLLTVGIFVYQAFIRRPSAGQAEAG